LALNIEQIYHSVRNFDFSSVLVRDLHWSSPLSNRSFDIDEQHSRREIARISGVPVFEINATNGKFPDSLQRDALYTELSPLFRTCLFIFLDKERTQSIWYWHTYENGQFYKREYRYNRGQPEDLFLDMLNTIISDLTISPANYDRKKAESRRISNKFVKAFEDQQLQFTQHIDIEDIQDRSLYATVLLTRLIFLYFLQRRGFLNYGDTAYFEHSLEKCNKNHYYRQFLCSLFFEGLAKPERNEDFRTLFGSIPYLGGSMFLPHEIELRYSSISIPDDAFATLFSFFSNYNWQIVDIPSSKDDKVAHDESSEITPDIIGDIFEIYFNQQSSARTYSTPYEIKDFFCRQTIHQVILDKINQNEPRPGRKAFKSVEEILERLDSGLCRKLLLNILPEISVLDPACGSGTFLAAALDSLLLLYSELIKKIADLNDDELKLWLNNIRTRYPNVMYSLKKLIIVNNLFGVDVASEAVETTRLRLYLHLIASIEHPEDIDPLPDLDFNLFTGNSLIGLLRLQDIDTIQTDLFTTHNFSLAREHGNFAISSSSLSISDEDLHSMPSHDTHERAEAIATLNKILLRQLHQLDQKDKGRGVRSAQKRQGEPASPIEPTIEDIKELSPFHWCYRFSSIMNVRGGFSVIITNPPWNIFKPESSAADYYQSLFYQNTFPHAYQKFRSGNVLNRASMQSYKLFVEQCYNLLSAGGYSSTIVPASICTDISSVGIRKLLFEQTQITSLCCFINSNYVLPVDFRFEFALLTFKKGSSTAIFPAAFSQQALEELDYFPERAPVHLSIDFLQRFSLDLLAINKFANQQEVDISEKLLSFPVLTDVGKNLWQLRFHQGVQLGLVHNGELSDPGPDTLPLFEGKMIGQFTHTASPPRYWISKEWLKQQPTRIYSPTSRLLNQWETAAQYKYRLAFRDIAASTNQRTLIATILPPDTLVSHHINCMVGSMDADELFFLVAILNSFIADFFTRLQVSLRVSISIVSRLPIPHLNKQDKFYTAIVERAGRLICTSIEFKNLWERAMSQPWSPDSAVTNPVARNKLSAELDSMIAHMYNVTEDEFTYILSTFPLVADPTKMATRNAYRDAEKGLLS
jgi:hypothetical protein